MADSGWAGEFACSECRRKRLPAVEFSKAQLVKARKDPETPIRCKACVAEGAKRERDAAASAATSAGAGAAARSTTAAGAAGAAARGATSSASPQNQSDATGSSDMLHECASCKQSLPATSFNKNQLRNKGPGKQRCQDCVSASEAKEASEAAAAQQRKLDDLRRGTAHANATGTSADRLKAASAECAAEAELVTGLKPIVIGRGRGGPNGWRGRSRGGGNARRGAR